MQPVSANRWPQAASCALLAALALWLVPRLRAGPVEDYQGTVRPILQKYCYKCHGPEKKKGELDLSVFTDYPKVLEAKEVWQLVLERVQAYEMPPEGQPGLDFSQHEQVLKWLQELPRPAQADCDRIASDRTANFYQGYVMSRRLNRAEYNNTVRDLFGVPLNLQPALPADGGGGEGFDTSGNALFVSSIHIEKYLAAAEQALAVLFPPANRGTAGRDQVDLTARARKRVLIARPTLITTPREAARKVVASFARRAFRRPVGDEEVATLLSLFDRVYKRGDGYEAALKLSLKAVLVSPNFLFLAEPEPETGGVQRLAAFPLASKLSYFLWSSMPDEELFGLAESGKLFETNIYRQQVRRMLADPKSASLGERFALQWLNLDRLGTEVRPDPRKFPEFNEELAASMRQEASVYFNYLVRQDRPLLELIDSDYTLVDDRLARLYGIQGIAGSGFVRVTLSDTNRGGVLGMPGIHALTSFPLRTSPVLRGRWIMEALLGEKIKPPPPDVPALDENPEKIASVTLREQLEAHRARPDCAACHDKMDPLGFGLENFDVLGRWREQDRGRPIDARGQLPSGGTYNGPAGLKQVLRDRQDQVMRHLVRKMLGYAYGRELNKFDDCVVEKTMKALRENQYRPSVLIEQIAGSYPFQHRFYAKDHLAYDQK